jgi:predicted DNA-binding transcriptional regulator AlpA
MTTRLIKTAPLLAKLGGISRMTLDRKIASDPTFPKPVYMGRQRFFDVDAVEAWMAERPTQHPDKRAA